MIPAQEQAAWFTGTLWKAVHFAGGVEQPRLFRAAIDPAWLPVLPLPTGSSRPQGQPVALLDNRHHTLERHLQDGTLRAAIEHRPAPGSMRTSAMTAPEPGMR
jgi:hypothetical protein